MTVGEHLTDETLLKLVGGVLFGARDPLASGYALAAWISRGTPMPREMAPDPQLSETARRLLDGRSEAQVERWCLGGASWVLGYRSAPERPGWEIVISQPRALGLPTGVGRTTGETVIGIVGRARERIAIASPFIDREALGILTQPLMDAADRGVQVLLLTQRAVDGAQTLVPLQRAFVDAGHRALLRVHHASETQPWPHLKLVVADAREAYVGSANLTGNALKGRNLELGVLLRGDLAAIDAVLESSAPR